MNLPNVIWLPSGVVLGWVMTRLSSDDGKKADHGMQQVNFDYEPE
jgi:hypothetical protein